MHDPARMAGYARHQLVERPVIQFRKGSFGLVCPEGVQHLAPEQDAPGFAEGHPMKRKQIDHNAPPPPNPIRVQLAVHGELAREIKTLMDRYGLEPAAVARMLMVDGLEARRARVA